ncbi:hypothetical protein QIS74_11677 [Colletotrichum tabaci]|uniref:Uncharacterized protein n=1 Tax=Colletotrichum tabaci TaxID=1209068 RepID=A0AAV9SYN5_9PEZI
MHEACFIIPIPKLVLGFIANLNFMVSQWYTHIMLMKGPSMENDLPLLFSLMGLINTLLETEMTMTFLFLKMWIVGMSGSQYLDYVSTMDLTSFSVTVKV